MSAALQLAAVWETSTVRAAWQIERTKWEREFAVRPRASHEPRQPAPPANLAFYRKQTESLLHRYLYASMQVGRAPSILSDSVGRGWASSRPVRTFEDALIFVLDIERCLSRIGWLDREILSRIVLQQFNQVEVTPLLGVSVRAISYKLGTALDRLTEQLLAAGLLFLPQ